jgi:hypothetical protein
VRGRVAGGVVVARRGEAGAGQRGEVLHRL